MRPPLLLCLFAITLACAIEFPAAFADEIIVNKAQRQLIFKRNEETFQFRIGLGTHPIGSKQQQGDRRTPEGTYFVTHKNPKSQYYLSIGLNYPNIDDARRGAEAGLISQHELKRIEKANNSRKLPPQNTPLGGDIFIHGRGSSTDWTWGCIALDDPDMKFLFENVKVGTAVSINP